MKQMKIKNAKRCSECSKIIRHWNKSGYCGECNRKRRLKK